MKTHLTLLLVISLFYAQIVYPQITVITQEHFPHANDTFVLAVDINPNVNLGEYALSQSWDFTSLNENLTIYACYGDVSELEFAEDFPTAHIYTYGPSFLYGGMFGASPESYGYLMFATDSDGYKIVGYRSDFGFGMTTVYNEPFEPLIWTPAEFDDVQEWYSSFEIRFEENPENYDTIYRRSIYKNLFNCAEGDLTTPFGFFENVLNVKETAIFVDSIFITYGGFTIYDSLVVRDTIVHYNFWSTEHRHPVAIVETDFEGNQKQARYLSWEILTEAKNSTVSENHNMFLRPNPATREVYLRGLQEDKSYLVEIYDMKGSLVFRENLQNKCNINISKLNKNSVYLFVIKDNGEVILKQRILKQ